MQPPSGGCVLKHQFKRPLCSSIHAAAFGRLCVETYRQCLTRQNGLQPPSGGCVLKLNLNKLPISVKWQPPSGGCVLKHDQDHDDELTL